MLPTSATATVYVMYDKSQGNVEPKIAAQLSAQVFFTI